MPNVILRAGWNARKPKTTPTYVSPYRREYFVVHHSGAPATQTVRAIQDWCMDGRDFNDIDYNMLVRATTGEIYEGRGWDIVGSHTTDFNTNGLGVCVIGNNEISDAAKASVRWLYDTANRRCGKTLKVRGHRDLATTGTTCPGDVIHRWLKAGMPAPTEEDDMPLNDTDLAKIRAVAKAAAIEAIDERAGRAVLGFDPGRNPENGSIWPAVANPRDVPFDPKNPATYGAGVGTMGVGSALTELRTRVDTLVAALTRDHVDEQAVAQALAPLIIAGIPSGEQVTEQTVENALRNVLGSLKP